jgi:hypothetical protein
MNKKDEPSGDKAESKERQKRGLGNPRERQRSFLRQRAATLRPHDDTSAETNKHPHAEQKDEEAEQDDDDATPRRHDERRKLLAQYRRRRQREK